MAKKSIRLVASKEVYKSKIFRITEDEATDGEGYRIKRSIIRHPGSAVMLAEDEKGRALLVRQYRLPAGRYMWELPAGRIDDGETALKAAKRELIEETGVRARKWEKLVEFYPTPGYGEEKVSVFLAKELTLGESHPMDDERIEAEWFTKAQLKKMLRNGEIIDGKTMVGFLYWRGVKG
jgi:ADP-ribose pyrophosphatase